LKNVAINETDHSTWEITKFKYGYLIKNVAYSEFLFAGEDMRARDQKHRQIFTSKDAKRTGDLVSISSTFYKQLLRAQIPKT